MSWDADQDRAGIDMARQDVDLMLELVPGARRFGSTYRAPCPVHMGERLSFGMRQRKSGAWAWRCWVCNEGGDLLDLMEKLGTPFKLALKELGCGAERGPETLDQKWERRWAQLERMKQTGAIHQRWTKRYLVCCSARGCQQLESFDGIELALKEDACRGYDWVAEPGWSVKPNQALCPGHRRELADAYAPLLEMNSAGRMVPRPEFREALRARRAPKRAEQQAKEAA